jgi:hypothetical protein
MVVAVVCPRHGSVPCLITGSVAEKRYGGLVGKGTGGLIPAPCLADSFSRIESEYRLNLKNLLMRELVARRLPPKTPLSSGNTAHLLFVFYF